MSKHIYIDRRCRVDSERDVVVEVAAGRTAAARAPVSAAAATAALPTAATRRAVEHRQHAADAADRDLGRVAVVARRVLPLAGAQAAFDVDLAALAQILLGDADQPVGLEHDRVPLGALLALAGVLVLPVLGGGDAQVGDAPAVLEALHFRVLPEVADQDDLVDAACHLPCFPLEFPAGLTDGPESRYPGFLHSPHIAIFPPR